MTEHISSSQLMWEEEMKPLRAVASGGETFKNNACHKIMSGGCRQDSDSCV